MTKRITAPYDCVVIGGGPAGLTAAIYLARFRRNIVVYDTNHSRALKIPLSRNYPGFSQGISGKELLENLRQQLSFYKIPVIHEAVDNLLKPESDTFLVTSTKGTVSSRNILLATGVEDIEPDLADIKQGIEQELIHHCPVCDAYELTNRKIAIIGKGKAGLEEALFLRDYTPYITLINMEKISWDKEDRQKISEAAINIINKPIQKIELLSASLKIRFDENTKLEYDSVYCALGCFKNNKLGAQLKARQKEGLFVVDKNQQTSVRGLFAAGDIVSNLHQLCVAEGQAAIAATEIHNRCRRLFHP